jgi:uncharacterized membrane protein
VFYDQSMTLTPLLAAPLAIQIHTFSAIAAFVLGLVQLVAAKGSLRHRLFGWFWIALMALVAFSSFFIHEIRMWGAWSVIHLLSLQVLMFLPIGALHARRGRIDSHRYVFTRMFVGALLVAGAFTLLPGRIMHSVVFG